MFETLLPGLSRAENVHPLFLHFPIAFWMTSLLFWTLGFLSGSARCLLFGRWLLYLGTIAAVPTAATGLWAESEIGHDSPGHEFIHVHRNWMIGTAMAALFTTGVAFGKRRSARLMDRAAVLALLLLTNALLVLGADRGAFLVYERGVGTHVVPQAETAPHDHEAEDQEILHHEPHGVEVPGE